MRLLALAVLVGLGAGCGAVLFRFLIQGLTRLFSGHADYSAAGHASNPLVPWLGSFFVLLAPVVAGLVYGPLVHRFAPEARGHGVPEVMLAVGRNGGRIRPQVALVKSVASALCIGGGGSVGREGPIVQIGSSLGSWVAQVSRLDERRIRLLVACGAAGGIAATFNAPLAGVFFAMELIPGQWLAESCDDVTLTGSATSACQRTVVIDDGRLVRIGGTVVIDRVEVLVRGVNPRSFATAYRFKRGELSPACPSLRALTPGGTMDP